MRVIEVGNLSKSFRSYVRREGVAGHLLDLVKRNYIDVKAVDGISFAVDRGELLGYIGPNGAGKSTSIKMLTGILKPTSGTMRVLEYDPFRDRKDYTRRIGVVFGQRTQLWWDIAVIESFKLLGSIYQVPPPVYRERLDELVSILNLSELLSTPVRKLSLGQRVRCDLAAALIHRPEVLFLDEPTIGLDAVAKDSTRNFLREINARFQTTIILTTHDLKEIEELCRRIIILDRGKIVHDGGLEAIRNLPGLGKRMYIDFTAQAPDLATVSGLFNDGLNVVKESERRLFVGFDPQQVPTVDLVRTVLGRFDVADLTLTEPSIEEVIIRLYRQSAAEQNG